MTDSLLKLLITARGKGDDKYLIAFVQKLPSCISGRFSEYLENGEGRSIAAHVRRANEAGVAKKPSYCVIPLTFDEHNEQSWYSEASCLNKFLPKGSGFWTNLHAKTWFDNQRVKYLKLWIES